MKHATLAALTLFATAVMATPAFAVFRPIQQPIHVSSTLQSFFDTNDPTIVAALEQDQTQGWGAPPVGNATATLMIEVTGNSGNNAIGVYNAGDPGPTTRFEILPANAGADWSAVASFHLPNTMKVSLFDHNGNPVGLTATYTGVSINSFGYYIHDKQTDVFGYTEDAENGTAVRALVYRGEGINTGSWWVCFDDSSVDQANDYDDAILHVRTVLATPVTKATWAAVKQRFR